MDRSSKAFRNVMTGLINKVVLMLLAFATRTSFIRLLGAQYTGINSLYTNILSVLSLAELGLGNVLMFYLYSALKEQNKEEIKHLIELFKKIYEVIIILILGIGIVIIPFLRFIVKSDFNNFELTIYFLLYLLNSVSSYFVIYRTMVLNADQKSYISNICSTIATIFMYILQIISLFVFHSFLIYLMIQLVCTILNNCIVNVIACKHYPYLRHLKKYQFNSKDSGHVKKELLRNVRATFLFKVSDTILDQTDNIIISVMFGTIYVGYYSNYYLLIVYLVNIGGIIANGLIASYGNLNIEGNKEKSFQMFKVSLHFFSMFGRICVIIYATIIQDFITIWIGKQYVMDYCLVISILFVFYLRISTNTIWIYRATMGLFKEVQYANLIAAVINIFLSIIGGKIMGVSGIIVATAISRLLTSFWFEGKIVFKQLKKPVNIYFKQQAKDLIVTLFSLISAFSVCALINLDGLSGIIYRIFLCTIVWLLFELFFYGKTEEFKLLKSKVIHVILKK